MGEERKLIKEKQLVEEIKNEVIECIKTYIDLELDSKLKPIINYFKKKKDFFEMDYL